MSSLQWCYSDKDRIIILTFLLVLSLLAVVAGECTCKDESDHQNKNEALKYKLSSIATVLVSGGIGVSIPFLVRKIEALRPKNNIFFMIKAFVVGVILATGFIHILLEAFETLTSPCLSHNPWGKFPFAGFVAMVASIGTLMVDTIATSFYKKMHFDKTKQVNVDEEASDEHAGHVHVHTTPRTVMLMGLRFRIMKPEFLILSSGT